MWIKKLNNIKFYKQYIRFEKYWATKNKRFESMISIWKNKKASVTKIERDFYVCKKWALSISK